MGFLPLKIFKKQKNQSDQAKIKLGPLCMALKKDYAYDTPHEISIIIPRVEIRKTIKTPLITFTKEIIYNSVTLVDAPRAPISNERTRPGRTPLLTKRNNSKTIGNTCTRKNQSNRVRQI